MLTNLGGRLLGPMAPGADLATATSGSPLGSIWSWALLGALRTTRKLSPQNHSNNVTSRKREACPSAVNPSSFSPVVPTGLDTIRFRWVGGWLAFQECSDKLEITLTDFLLQRDDRDSRLYRDRQACHEVRLNAESPVDARGTTLRGRVHSPCPGFMTHSPHPRVLEARCDSAYSSIESLQQIE